MYIQRSHFNKYYKSSTRAMTSQTAGHMTRSSQVIVSYARHTITFLGGGALTSTSSSRVMASWFEEIAMFDTSTYRQGDRVRREKKRGGVGWQREIDGV